MQAASPRRPASGRALLSPAARADGVISRKHTVLRFSLRSCSGQTPTSRSLLFKSDMFPLMFPVVSGPSTCTDSDSHDHSKHFSRRRRSELRAHLEITAVITFRHCSQLWRTSETGELVRACVAYLIIVRLSVSVLMKCCALSSLWQKQTAWPAQRRTCSHNLGS